MLICERMLGESRSNSLFVLLLNSLFLGRVSLPHRPLRPLLPWWRRPPQRPPDPSSRLLLPTVRPSSPRYSRSTRVALAVVLSAVAGEWCVVGQPPVADVTAQVGVVGMEAGEPTRVGVVACVAEPPRVVVPGACPSRANGSRWA